MTAAQCPSKTFFKGCWLEKGRLHFCPGVAQIGELLHEAGHLALLPQRFWNDLKPGNLPDHLKVPIGSLSIAGDAAVEAWDYAAAIAIGIPVASVFIHGFNGLGEKVWESFEAEFHPGFALLRILGMSSRFGVCDRWILGDPDDREPEFWDEFSPREGKAILRFLEMAIEKSKI